MTRPSLFLALLLPWVAVLSFNGAHAATVDLRGPAGAEVFLEGRSLGTLPFDEPLEIEVGEYQVEFRLPGHAIRGQMVRVRSEDAAMRVEVDLLPLSRWRSAGYSAVLAGLGQLYQQRSTMGWTMMGVQLAAASAAIWAETQFQSHLDDFGIADGRYRDAVAPTRIVQLRAERDAAYDDMESSETIRNAAIVGVVAVGVWSVLDAWWGLDDVYVETHTDTAAGFDRAEPQWRLGWATHF